MDERIAKLKTHIEAMNAAGPRRTTYFPLVAESLEETVGEARQIRRAKAFAHLLDRVDQRVLPHECLVGSISGMWPPAEDVPTYPEIRREAERVLRSYRERRAAGELPGSDGPSSGGAGSRRRRISRWALIARDHYDASVEYADLQRVISEMKRVFADDEYVTPVDVGREIEHHFVFDYGDKTRRLLDELPWVVANHLHLDYGKLMRVGFGGLRNEIETGARRAADELTGNPREEALEFYRAARIAVDASVRFIRRYAETTACEAEKPEHFPGRAVELKELSRRIERIAEAAPSDFGEGMQLLWLAHLISNIGGGSAMSFARFDQYMNPLYEKSIAEGTVNRDEAKRLISCMWLKVNEPKMRTVQSLALGGTDADGNDTSNDLTRLCLEVVAELKQPFPNTCLRVHSQTPDDLYDLALQAIHAGAGNPMLMNDDTWVVNLQKRGVSKSVASQYFNMGCVEVMLGAKQPFWHGVSKCSFPQVLLSLLETARDYESFEQFLEAYLSTVRASIGRAHEDARRFLDDMRDRYYDPYGSCLVEGCLQAGRDMYQGGAALPGCFPVGGAGLGTAVDSLSAIRRFVFQDGTLSLDELHDALASNFADQEPLRCLLESRAPCFGNNLEDVDELAAKVLGAYTGAVQALNDGSVEGQFVSSVFSYTSQISAGEMIGATPNGRQAGAAISDNAGPTQGKDVAGPTALLGSISNLPLTEITGAYAMNVKIQSSFLESEVGHTAFKNLIKTHFRMGGLQLQINCLDQKVLQEAQEHPELHPNLIVRVAGFSEYFRNLDRSLQDEIISRVAHSEPG
jgi:formate C-acetyltransferase